MGVAAFGLLGAALVAGASVWLLSEPAKDSVQYAGWLLEALGIGCVIHGLMDAQRRYKRPPLRAIVSRWFGLVATAFQPPRNEAVVAASIGSSTAFGTATVATVGPTPATVEERLAALEQGLNDLRARLASETEGLRRGIGTLQQDLQRERNEREAGDKRALQEIEDQAIGGFVWEALGLFWTFVGIVLTGPWMA